MMRSGMTITEILKESGEVERAQARRDLAYEIEKLERSTFTAIACSGEAMKHHQIDDDSYVEAVRSKLPRYVSDRARSLAMEALDDVDNDHREARVYALARWFDAVMANR